MENKLLSQIPKIPKIPQKPKNLKEEKKIIPNKINKIIKISENKIIPEKEKLRKKIFVENENLLNENNNKKKEKVLNIITIHKIENDDNAIENKKIKIEEKNVNKNIDKNLKKDIKKKVEVKKEDIQPEEGSMMAELLKQFSRKKHNE